jgi:hypothetical protein
MHLAYDDRPSVYSTYSMYPTYPTYSTYYTYSGLSLHLFERLAQCAQFSLAGRFLRLDVQLNVNVFLRSYAAAACAAAACAAGSCTAGSCVELRSIRRRKLRQPSRRTTTNGGSKI